MSSDPSQMHSLSANCPRLKIQAHLGKTCISEPSVRHKAIYTGCTNDKEANAVANAIYRDLVLVHGCPEILLSDNGKNLLMIFGICL